MTDRNEERLLRMLGLCRRAGRLVTGSEQTCMAMAARKKPCLIVLASDASDATARRIGRKCFYYQLPLLRLDAIGADALGHAVGRSGAIAAAAVRDENFASEIIKLSGKDASALQAETGV